MATMRQRKNRVMHDRVNLLIARIRTALSTPEAREKMFRAFYGYPTIPTKDHP